MTLNGAQAHGFSRDMCEYRLYTGRHRDSYRHVTYLASRLNTVHQGFNFLQVRIGPAYFHHIPRESHAAHLTYLVKHGLDQRVLPLVGNCGGGSRRLWDCGGPRNPERCFYNVNLKF